MASAATNEGKDSVGAGARELTPLGIIQYMKDEQFEFRTHWIFFLQLIGHSLDEITPYIQASTLDTDVEQYLEDCLDKWLKNVRGSWGKVKEAMDIMRSEHHATVILRLHEQVIVQRFDCEKFSTLVVTLNAEGLIDHGDEQLDSPTDVAHLIDCSIKNTPSHLLKLIDILRNFPDKCLNELAHKLDRECSQSITLRGIMSMNDGPEEVSVPLSPTLKEQFSIIIIEYKYLLEKVIELIMEAVESFSEDDLRKLRKHVEDKNLYDTRTRENHTDLEMIKSFVYNNSSVLDTANISAFVKQFNIEEGTKAVTEYEDRRKSICGKIKADGIINRRLCSRNLKNCETITFTVKWEVTDATIDDMEQLLYSAFGYLKREIQVVRLKKGNSIVITCCAPEMLIGLLIYKAQKNLPLLKEKGVMSLKIGYCTLLDHKADFEINEPHLKKQLKGDLVKLKEENETLQGRIKELEIVLHDNGIKIPTTESDEEVFYESSDKMVIDEESHETIPESELDEESPSKVQKLLHEKDDEIETLRTLNRKAYQQIDSLRAQNISWNQELQQMKDQKMSLESVVDKLKEEALPKEPDASLQQTIESRIPVLYYHSKVSYPPVDVTMNKFSERRREKEHWYSPSFYSHPGGYKLCIKLRAYGQYEGEGTHLSLSVYLMSGDYDHRLAWPFKGEIKLQLLNQRADSGHINATVRFDNLTSAEASGRVLSGLKTPSGTVAGRGVHITSFVRLKDLPYNSTTGTEYLRDDAVFVRVNKVTVDQQMLPVVPEAVTGEPKGSVVAEFTMSNFSKLRAKNEKWNSDPFYFPHSNGYKFLLAVHSNGRDAFKDKSISVYTHIMKGENDDNLKWPFRGIIIVQLINQRDKKRNHVKCRIDYSEKGDPKGRFGARVNTFSAANLFASGRSYNGWGYPDFVKHEFLPYNSVENTQYLSDDDELVFRIVDFP